MEKLNKFNLFFLCLPVAVLAFLVGQLYHRHLITFYESLIILAGVVFVVSIIAIFLDEKYNLF